MFGIGHRMARSACDSSLRDYFRNLAMRKFYKIMFKFFLIGMVALVVFGMIMGRSSGPDKTAASNFVIASSSGDLPQAYKALHQNLQKELSITEFSEGFKSIIPYVKVSFNSISVVLITFQLC